MAFYLTSYIDLILRFHSFLLPLQLHRYICFRTLFQESVREFFCLKKRNVFNGFSFEIEAGSISFSLINRILRAIVELFLSKVFHSSIFDG